MNKPIYITPQQVTENFGFHFFLIFIFVFLSVVIQTRPVVTIFKHCIVIFMFALLESVSHRCIEPFKTFLEHLFPVSIQQQYLPKGCRTAMILLRSIPCNAFIAFNVPMYVIGLPNG